MSSRIVYGQRSTSRDTGSAVLPPWLDSRPKFPARVLPSSSSSESTLSTLGFPASVSLSDSSMACTAASSLARVVKPTQNFLSRSTGKSLTSSCLRANFTALSVVSGGRMASAGSLSQSSTASLFSMTRGGSARRKGMFLRRICSSSKPRSLKSWFNPREMVTLSISGGMRLGSLAQPVMKTTTATAICLNPHSMAALPTIA
mmetsp:Transcript_54687/g.140793  ORF Transcript_54687/g.140793 Transcript_54687/m.140793 type:complete len:202 (-) Transcript_54687:1597-2202(-)